HSAPPREPQSDPPRSPRPRVSPSLLPDRRQPGLTLRDSTTDDGLEVRRQPGGNRTRPAAADDAAIDRSHGRDLGAGAAEEHLVGNVQLRAPNRSLHEGDAPSSSVSMRASV